jgi:hypothetical protein
VYVWWSTRNCRWIHHEISCDVLKFMHGCTKSSSFLCSFTILTTTTLAHVYVYKKQLLNNFDWKKINSICFHLFQRIQNALFSHKCVLCVCLTANHWYWTRFFILSLIFSSTLTQQYEKKLTNALSGDHMQWFLKFMLLSMLNIYVNIIVIIYILCFSMYIVNCGENFHKDDVDTFILCKLFRLQVKRHIKTKR